MKKALALIVACVAVTVVGCGTIQKHQLASSVVIQGLTLRAIEESGNRAEKANAILSAAEDARVMLDMEGVTLDQLTAKMRQRIAQSDSELSEKLVLSSLVDVAEQTIDAKISDGMLDPEAKVTVNQVLGWIIMSARAYAT